jgi:hypothetical protein
MEPDNEAWQAHRFINILHVVTMRIFDLMQEDKFTLLNLNWDDPNDRDVRGEGLQLLDCWDHRLESSDTSCRVLAGVGGSNPAGSMDVCVVITRPEES